jgi:hypothetical protein
MTFKDLLAEPCSCAEKTDKCCYFQSLKSESVNILNRIAKDNSTLRIQLEKLKSQLENHPQGENVGENGKSQLVNLRPPFFKHPSKGKVPIRNKGKNGSTWESYRDSLKDAFGVYDDVANMAISEMMNEGFTDHDIVDALFPCANGERRMSTHNAGPCHHTP